MSNLNPIKITQYSARSEMASLRQMFDRQAMAEQDSTRVFGQPDIRHLPFCTVSLHNYSVAVYMYMWCPTEIYLRGDHGFILVYQIQNI